MRYFQIRDLNTLASYCNKNTDKCCISINHTSPFHNTDNDNYLGELYSSPTKALGYRLFNNYIIWNNISRLQGIIYSYDTPIGIIVNESLLFVRSKELPFKSVTTKKLVTILNRNCMNIEYNIFIMIIKALGIDLGWLE